MNASQLLQLYAPLAGLVGLAFWTGMLTQKVNDLKVTVAHLQEAHTGEGGSSNKLAVLESQMQGVKESLDRLVRGQDGIQRQLGNMMKPGGFVEVP